MIATAKKNNDRSVIAIAFAKDIAKFQVTYNGEIKGKIAKHSNIFLNNTDYLMQEAQKYCDRKKLLLMLTYCPFRKKYGANLAKSGRSYNKYYDQEMAVCLMQAILCADTTITHKK